MVDINKGKELEQEVKDYLISKGVFYCKFNDTYSSRSLTTSVPADFLVVPSQEGVLVFLLECKETQKSKLPLSSFRPKQLKTMRQVMRLLTINYYILIKYNNYYIVTNGKDIIDELDSGKRSIDLNKGYMKFVTIDEVMDYLMTI